MTGGESGTGRSTGGDKNQSVTASQRLSRRQFTKAIGAGAGTFVLGGVGVGSAAGREERSGLWDTLDVGGGDFTLQVNPWGSQRTGAGWDQTIWTEPDGAYGYEFGAEGSSKAPNIPEVILGAKPWGPDTGVTEFPKRRRNIDEFSITFDIDQQINGENWDLMCEWWLSDTPPPNGGNVSYEIMVVLTSGKYYRDEDYESSVYTDQYGNTIDWRRKNAPGGTGADFHRFALSSGTTSGAVDLRRLMDFVTDRLDVSGDLWVSGVELGNEVYRGVSGETTFNRFDVTVNGTRYTSGPDGGNCQSVHKAIANDNNQINKTELQQAIEHWQNSTKVPGTCGTAVSDDTILAMIHQWRENT